MSSVQIRGVYRLKIWVDGILKERNYSSFSENIFFENTFYYAIETNVIEGGG